MTPALNSTTGNGSATAQPKGFLDITTAPTILTRFEERATLSGTDISPEEYREIMLLDEFLTHHVRPDGLRDVQCMLLWSEWVRSFQRKTHRFPRVVLETEFRDIVTDQLGVGITKDDHRGMVYPGLRFVP